MAEGFIIPERRATLVVDEPPYEGAEIEVSLSVSLGAFLGIQRWAAGSATLDQSDPSAVAEYMEGAARIFAENALRGWNLARETGPVPATFDGLMSLGVDLLSTIITAWLGAMNRPLASRSRKHNTSAGSSTAASRRGARSRKTRRST